MLEILSWVANRIRNPRFDIYLEELEKKESEKQKQIRLAKTLAHAKSVVKYAR